MLEQSSCYYLVYYKKVRLYTNISCTEGTILCRDEAKEKGFSCNTDTVET